FVGFSSVSIGVVSSTVCVVLSFRRLPAALEPARVCVVPLAVSCDSSDEGSGDLSFFSEESVCSPSFLPFKHPVT
ncbi:hypothetical protein ACQ10C_15270, partial [Enterococcus faecalis]|uniref:hypothetical protein n=1 Tax=Enterococcus faecalis TaxID=1351 RepID=UPI003D6B822C